MAYYYCDFRDADSQRPESVIGALLCQLILQLESWPTVIDRSMERHTADDGRVYSPKYEELERLLMQVLISLSPLAAGMRVTLVIDALDECSDREKLLQLLISVANNTGCNIRVFVTSRREPDIEQILKNQPQVPLRESEVDRDVAIYVEHTMKTATGFTKLNDSLREFVAQSLVSGCNGMYDIFGPPLLPSLAADDL